MAITLPAVAGALGVILGTAVLTCRFTALHALAALGAVAVPAGLVLGLPDTLAVVAGPGVLGLMYGLGFKNRLLPGKILTVGLAVGLLLAAGESAVRLAGEDPAVLAAAGALFPGGTEAALTEPAELAEWFAAAFFPGTLAARAIILAWGGFFAAAGVLRRLALLPGAAPDFHRWRLPWPAVWLVIAGLAAILAGDHWGLPPAVLAGRNLLFVAGVVYLAAGLTLAAYIHREIVPSWWRIPLLAAALLAGPATLLLLAAAGFLDSWSDFRIWYEQRREQP